MRWVGERVHDDALAGVYAEVAELADWSEWLPFETGLAEAPRRPGV